MQKELALKPNNGLNTPNSPIVTENKKHMNSNHLLHRLYDLQTQLHHIPKQSITTLADELALPVSQIEAAVG